MDQLKCARGVKMFSVSDEYLKLPEVSRIAKLSGQTIRRLEKINKFPRRHTIGVRSVAWLRSDIEMWMAGVSAVDTLTSVENGKA